MAITGFTETQAERFRSVASVVLGFVWIFPITGVATPVSILLDFRYLEEYRLWVVAELMLLASLVLPLAFTHSPRASLGRIWVIHAGVFTIVSTFCLLLSPMAPFWPYPIESDYDASPVFIGPLTVWATLGGLVLAVDMICVRWAARLRDSVFLDLCHWGLLTLLIGAHWAATQVFIVGGFPLLSRTDSLLESAIRFGIGTAYLAISTICAGVFSHGTRTPPSIRA